MDSYMQRGKKKWKNTLEDKVVDPTPRFLFYFVSFATMDPLMFKLSIIKLRMDCWRTVWQTTPNSVYAYKGLSMASILSVMK